jgi:hypothetical protein
LTVSVAKLDGSWLTAFANDMPFGIMAAFTTTGNGGQVDRLDRRVVKAKIPARQSSDVY